MRERILWIDNARGICMLCVLLAHTLVDHYYLYLVYTPWFLTLFFLISGYLIRTKSLKDDSLKMLRALIVPYFILSIILFCLGIDNISAIKGGDIPFVVKKIENIVLGYQLWFVACIILVQTLFIVLKHTIMRRRSNEWIVGILLCISIVFTRNSNLNLPYYGHIAVFALSFFIFGDLLKNVDLSRYSNLIKMLSFKKKVFYSLGVILCYAMLCVCADRFFDMEFHFIKNSYNNIPIFLLLSFLGMVSVFILSNMMSSNYLRLLGANSLICFTFNGKALALAKFVLPLSWVQDTYMVAIILAFFESIILLLISFLINRYCPIIVGKKKKRHMFDYV